MYQAFSFFILSFLTLLLLIHVLTKLLQSMAAAAANGKDKINKVTKYYGPKSYPIIGSSLDISANIHRLPQYFSDHISRSPTRTIAVYRPFGGLQIVTGNPANVEHVLKTAFHVYPKGPTVLSTNRDFMGDGIFNADGDTWKIQRKIASHEFNNKSLKKFVATVVTSEISARLLPLLSSSAAASAASTTTVLDLQDVLQRFAFDNICKVSFGWDPEFLAASELPESRHFSAAFDEVLRLTADRVRSVFPLLWKIRRALGISPEKRLKEALSIINKTAVRVIKERKETSILHDSDEDREHHDQDLLSRFLGSGQSEEFIRDIVISFILAGRDTTSAALTWFFWLVSGNERVESEILKEILSIDHEVVTGFEEVKEMTYLHAAICESMRLYPPVPIDTKEAAKDDVLPDGTVVPKGSRISYCPYAMGRLESLWGEDWKEYRPERWLEKIEEDGKIKWRFVGEDSFKYPVFQAGPRVCLGKDMAFLQMKSIAATVLRRYRLVPAIEGFDPVYIVNLTAKMKGGFPVKVEVRN